MASLPRLFLIAFVFLGFIAIGTNARPGLHFHPCKTLFISYTISSIKSPQSRNPNDRNPSRFFTIFSEIREFHPRIILPSVELITDDGRPDLRRPIRHFRGDDVVKPDIARPSYPFGFSHFGSLRERTKDILSVVVALLFGVGCGALTSATMYLAWSLITNRFEFNDSEREGEDGDDSDGFDDYDVKKMGYVKIPDDTVAVQVKQVKLMTANKFNFDGYKKHYCPE
ncbi:uncharacterized protein LOC122084239 [Macadamia integrifolia]|uniref:uncharacterized protein LOC122084239 n=1 Tax=Macadamia integrifolia TaxID=60698 RepID=UPI001C4FE220|nr:uncharacterized protein LOC122084239 [Macadamia integrifolia]